MVAGASHAADTSESAAESAEGQSIGERAALLAPKGFAAKEVVVSSSAVPPVSEGRTEVVAQPELSLKSQTIISALPPLPHAAAAPATHPSGGASSRSAVHAPVAAAQARAAREARSVHDARSASETSAGQSNSDDLGRELALLNDARVALGRDPQRALSLLVRHEREFATGLFVEERLALRVLALCRLGDQERAHREAEDFLRNHGASPLAARLRTSCALLPAESANGHDVPMKERHVRGHEEAK
jgi:hypothetical protein